MRISNFGKGRRVTVMFRLCLAIIVLLTMAVGGITLNTQPVKANGYSIIHISNCPTEPLHAHCGPYYVYDFDTAGSSMPSDGWGQEVRFEFSTATGTPWNNPYSPVFTNSQSTIYMEADGKLHYHFCDPDINKTYIFAVWVSERWWYNDVNGNPHMC
jgi:hypothetical protein